MNFSLMWLGNLLRPTSPPRRRRKEIPEHEPDQRHGADYNCPFHRVERHIMLPLNDRKRRLFVRTETLDSDIAALAIIGDMSQPVTG